MTLRRHTILVLLAACTLPAVLASCGGSDEAPPPAAGAVQQPYAGLETRAIAALAPEQVDDLLAGRGAGYALAAELNHYPGPTHVLEFVSELGLTPEQDDAIRQIKQEMQQEAQLLGKERVDLEAELDEAFSSGTIAPSRLRELTAAIAVVDGSLRNAHLAAHIEVKALLSEEQVRQYDALRGYTGADQGGQQSSPGHGHSE